MRTFFWIIPATASSKQEKAAPNQALLSVKKETVSELLHNQLLR
jgi:hypothetical protein